MSSLASPFDVWFAYFIYLLRWWPY